jgi:hypothetical protein
MSTGHDLVVHFHAPPSAVVVADPAAPLPRMVRAPVTTESLNAAPNTPSAAPTVQAPAKPTAPPEPAGPDPLELEVTRRLQADRALIQKTMDTVTAALKRVEEEHRGRLAEWRRSAVELAVTIATRLIRDRVKADDFAVEAIVRDAAALLSPRGPFTVRLHPADVALMQTRLGGAPLFADGAGSVMVMADLSQSRGNCRVETNDASVTARLSEQLAGVREELLRSLADAEPGS